MRACRDSAAVEHALAALKAAAADEARNLTPFLVSAARAYATEGEVVSALQDVWGSYTETPVF